VSGIALEKAPLWWWHRFRGYDDAAQNEWGPHINDLLEDRLIKLVFSTRPVSVFAPSMGVSASFVKIHFIITIALDKNNPFISIGMSSFAKLRIIGD